MTDRDTGTLGKAMVVLDLIAKTSAPLRFSDIMVATGEPRGTLHRRLRQLREEGLVETLSDGRYALGLRLMHLASQAWAKSDVRLIARPHLESLQRKVGETVHFGILTGTEITYLDKVEASQTVRMYSRVGALSPAYCTGIGKAALARLPDDVVGEILAQMKFERFTAATARDRDELATMVAAIRETGFAYDLEEHESGICCIAAGFLADGKAGGVSITAPAYRADRQRLDEWRQDLREATTRIEFEIGARRDPTIRSAL